MESQAETSPDGAADAIVADANARRARTAALHSSESSEWGTAEVTRRFAAAVLRPAATGASAIDLDMASSLYWHEQWAHTDRPRQFFDGSEGRDALDPVSWTGIEVALLGSKLDKDSDVCVGSAFCNPPSTTHGSRDLGSTVQAFWDVFEGRHAAGKLHSGCWIGFSTEQMRSLIPPHASLRRARLPASAMEGSPRSPTNAAFCTVLPGKRLAYMCHPLAMIAIIERKLAKLGVTIVDRVARVRGSVDGVTAPIRALLADLDKLLTRADDSPVVGPSPTHASYLTFLWHRDGRVRKRQQQAMHAFLKGQSDIPKSPYYTYALIGDAGG